MGLLLVLLGGVLLILVIRSVQSDDEYDEYLYGMEDPDAVYPVIEYMNPTANNASLADDNATAVLPDFLSSTKSGHRVVEFYAPWCPHCIHFKESYVRFARNLTDLAARMGQHVDVYSVSCQAHRPICLSQDVHGYPKIKIFPAGSINGTLVNYWQLHPFHVLQTLGIQAGEFTPVDITEHTLENPPFQKKLRHSTPTPNVRTKEEIYSDAFLSFDFALRNSIFMSSGAMSNTSQDAFLDWLTLLQQTMPPTWKIHSPINAIMQEFDSVVEDESNLLALVAPFRPDKKRWSASCTHGGNAPGYTCGLWELFHIMTIGVVEWNELCTSDSAIIPTMEAADTLRNYIANFFGCEVCQSNFLSSYDACAHNRCSRLTNDNDDRSEWKQLPLWLWETHNAVNVRLMMERAERQGKTTSAKDEIDARWPSRRDCPLCWNDDGSWDDDLIYRYLRMEYWPDDAASASFRRKLVPVLEDIERENYEDAVFPAFLLFILIVVLLSVLLVWYTKKVQRDKSGRHKKYDSA